MLDQQPNAHPAPLGRLAGMLGRAAICAVALLISLTIVAPGLPFGGGNNRVDEQLTARLHAVGFTGQIESTLTRRLGRTDQPAAGRQLALGRAASAGRTSLHSPYRAH